VRKNERKTKRKKEKQTNNEKERKIEGKKAYIHFLIRLIVIEHLSYRLPIFQEMACIVSIRGGPHAVNGDRLF